VLGYIKKIIWIKAILFLAVCFLFAACNNNYKPKPRGYNHINFPTTSYENVFIKKKYSFDKNTLAKLNINDSLGWLNLLYNKYGAEVLVTYKPIYKKSDLSDYINESYKLINQHNKKAASIKETFIKTTKGVDAVIIELTGDVPTQFQFITTDSVNHFLRGALYFETATKNDSLAPIIKYIKKDMIHLLNTLRWNEK
jgi:gliding motility-associated lipoprotein GldD|tara:strand:+ start:767 stop:1357 length:591 start_codon:yes stop_codon:yes gene_type:complete